MALTTYRPSDPVFVFGSNIAGWHGKGAALFALQHRGAQRGVGEGAMGRSYAIPTKDSALRQLPIERVAVGVSRFLDYVRGQPGEAFQVTRIGCGLAGYADADIAPMFATAPANCVLPYRWTRLLHPGTPPRVIVAGSRSFSDYCLLRARLDVLLARLPRPLTIVWGCARGADTLGARYADDRGIAELPCPADWDRYGKAAGMIRNQHMSWCASHLVAFWDGSSSGTKGMIEIARADGLDVRVVLI